jgi:hypothetical protein
MSLPEIFYDIEKRHAELVQKSPKTEAEGQESLRLGRALEGLLREEVKPLTDELATVGIKADVWDLVNTSARYEEAIPILVKHLRKPYHRKNKEGIVRALAVKEAKGIANKTIMEEYRKAPKEDHHFRWAFGNTLNVIVTRDDLDDLIEIVLDETNGNSRQMFVRALAKLKLPRVKETLHKLTNDKSFMVAEEAKKALNRKRPAN